MKSLILIVCLTLTACAKPDDKKYCVEMTSVEVCCQYLVNAPGTRGGISLQDCDNGYDQIVNPQNVKVRRQ